MNAPLDTITVPIGEAQLTVPVQTLVRTFLEKHASTRAVRLTELRAQSQVLIGAKGVYGIYAGIGRRTADAAVDNLVEVLEEVPAERMTWQEALSWAASIGGALPTRREAALLFANVPELFEKDYYWIAEQYESGPSYAWCQSFDYGYQLSSR